ncbi:MAG: phosphate regulon sensor histidine kinase PhoR [Gammaproteobacteria bacterium]
MSNPWIEELWRTLGVAAASLLIGVLFDAVAPALLLGLGVYAAWHMRQVYRLEYWLRYGKRFHPPEARGIWEDIFQMIYRLQQRNRKRKRKLGTMLSQFQQATAALPDATVVLGDREHIAWWNDAAEQLLGLHYPRDVGQNITNLVRHPAFIAYLRGGAFDLPIQIPAPGNLHLSLSLRLIDYGKDQRLLLARDISHLQQLERVRSDFVANVSHELRTPLTVLAGYLETLIDEVGHEVPAHWQKSLSVMHEQSDRMRRIVEDLLILARLESQALPDSQQPVGVPGLLAQVCEDARRLSGEQGHRITLEANPELWLLGVDNELRGLFSNLAFNAVRYTPAGGAIQLRWYGDAQGAHFAITDTGIGIAAQHIPRLTERFYRVDAGRSREGGGTGLGLAIVKHVLLRHDGRLQVESTPGKGSVFRCDFPPARVSMQAPPAIG